MGFASRRVDGGGVIVVRVDVARYRRWTGSALFVVAAVAVAVELAVGGHWVSAVLAILVGFAIAGWLAPIRRRASSVDFATAMAEGQRGGVVVFWRPGCSYCLRLKLRLGRLGSRAHWVNIWADAAAAEYVRSVNGGNETVPTVLIGGTPLTNPTPAVVEVALTDVGA